MTQPPPKRRGLYPGNPLKLHFQPSHPLNFGKLFCVFAGSLSDSVQNDFFIWAYIPSSFSAAVLQDSSKVCV